MLDYVLIRPDSTVPTRDQILVPETLLKKRKSQEKARAEKSAEIEKRKKVSFFHVRCRNLNTSSLSYRPAFVFTEAVGR